MNDYQSVHAALTKY